MGLYTCGRGTLYKYICLCKTNDTLAQQTAPDIYVWIYKTIPQIMFIHMRLPLHFSTQAVSQIRTHLISITKFMIKCLMSVSGNFELNFLIHLKCEAYIYCAHKTEMFLLSKHTYTYINIYFFYDAIFFRFNEYEWKLCVHRLYKQNMFIKIM